MSRHLALALAALFLATAGASDPGAAQGCLSGSEGRQLMEQGEVMPFPEAMQRAGLSADEVVEVELCQSGSGYVYRVRILQDGQVSSKNIPAG